MGKLHGASPSESRYYVLVLFDISDARKYRSFVKVVKRYATRVQKSVFEAYLKSFQVKEMIGLIERLMKSDAFFNPDDRVRIYKISGNCDVVDFGVHQSNLPEENIFF